MNTTTKPGVLAVGDRVAYDYNGRACTGTVILVRPVDGACSMRDDFLRNGTKPFYIGPIQADAITRIGGDA